MSAQEFYLTQMEIALTTLTGVVSGSDNVPITDFNATVEVDVSLDYFQNLFQFFTDSEDIDNINGTDIKYKVVHNNLININVDADATVTVNPINAISGINNSVTFDFVRYLAQSLFGTDSGTDLFSNELELRQDISGNFNSELNAKLEDLEGDGILLTDDTPISPTQTIISYLLKTDPSRFQNLIQYATDAEPLAGSWYKSPLIDGDIINFKVTINPAVDQELLTGLDNPIPSRSYLFKCTLKATVT